MITKEITDSLGRKIKLREINGKTRVAFYRALGARDAGNFGIVNEYWNTMAVASIDNAVIPSFKSLVDIEVVASDIENGNFSTQIDKFLADIESEKARPVTEDEDQKK